ncbi:MAG: regulatory protein RecX [Candidatus Paceibacterota bacterium]
MEGSDLLKYLLERCIKQVYARPRSEREMRIYLARLLSRRVHKLKEKDKFIDEVIEGLKKKKYLDDDKFIAWWVQERLYFKPRGSRALVSELRAKGVASERIDEYFQVHPLDEQEFARRALKSSVWRRRDFSDPQIRKKALSYLARKGFSYEISKNAIEELDKT